VQRRALVTGASSGIGQATALRLAREGYRVALLARSAERLERLAVELEGEGHLVLVCDLCAPEQIARSFERLQQEFGGLELLVNNAGVGYRARVEELEDEALQRLFDTNVLALLFTCRAALPLLRRGEAPVVVNVSSVVGRRGIPGQVAYAASKAAVCSIGEGLRIEWAEERISVCTLDPALTATGFFEAQPNPAGLPDPDLSGAAGPDGIALEILKLDREPHPERTLRWKWHLLGILSLLAPRLADRLLVRNLGGGWRAPR
jgi:NAD(P)-dependent dehydrogenase (short-subunit alcohol dehydrogenase family)